MAGRTSTLALLTFVCALLGHACLPLAPLGFILGIAALLRLRGPAGERLRGRWMASSGFAICCIQLLLAAGGGTWLWLEWPRLRCNRNLVNIGKALKEYQERMGQSAYTPATPGDTRDALDRLVAGGFIDEDQTRCPAAARMGEAGARAGRYVLLPEDRAGETGIIAHDAERYHDGERGVLHAPKEIDRSPTRFRAAPGGGMSYEYEYLLLWLGDPMPEDRFRRILDQRFPSVRFGFGAEEPPPDGERPPPGAEEPAHGSEDRGFEDEER